MQMNWRLNEGRGECMYMLGYEDDGKATGMTPSEMSASIKTLRVMMEAVGAKIANMQVRRSLWICVPKRGGGGTLCFLALAVCSSQASACDSRRSVLVGRGGP